MQAENLLVQIIDHFGYEFTRINEQVASLEEFPGLSFAQIGYLEMVERLKHPSFTDLAKSLKVTKPSVTVAVQKLISGGYLEKVQADEDKRSQHIHLGKRGVKFLKAHRRVHAEVAKKIASAFKEKEKGKLCEMLEKILKKLESERAQRMIKTVLVVLLAGYNLMANSLVASGSLTASPIAPLVVQQATPFSKDAYLQEVKAKNLLLKSSLLAADSAKKQVEEQRLLTSPWFFTEYQHGIDKSPTVDSLVTIDTKAFNKVSAGLETQTDFGISARVTYDMEHYSLEGISPIILPLGPTIVTMNFVTMPKYYSGKLSAELKLDLLKNFLGSEVRAQKTAISAKNEAMYFEKLYQAKQVLLGAEMAYWELAIAREAVKIHEQVLARANELNTWMQGRIYLNLQDQSDINQSKAGVQYSNLELKGAIDAEKSAVRTFNYFRGVDSDKVEEEIKLPAESDLIFMAEGLTFNKRADLLALLRNLEAAKAGASLKKEMLSPRFSVGASASLLATDPDLPTAFNNSFKTDKYVYGVGANLRIPLDFPGDGERTYDAEWQALETYIEAKKLELSIELSELNRKLADVKERLLLAVELERLQKNKANAEREKLNKGNSVTYQVLTFEQDWSKSQLGVLEIKKGILSIISRLKLYEGN